MVVEMPQDHILLSCREEVDYYPAELTSPQHHGKEEVLLPFLHCAACYFIMHSLYTTKTAMMWTCRIVFFFFVSR